MRREHALPLNCERVFTNSVGYVMNLCFPQCGECQTNMWKLMYANTDASTAPAVVPAMSECSGSSFLDAIVLAVVEDVYCREFD